jgi:hypothetical protein
MNTCTGTAAARGRRIALENTDTAGSVKASGSLRTPPRLEAAIRGFKSSNSSRLNRNGKSSENRVEKFGQPFHPWVMPKEDPRIDRYIAGSADFARPILNHLRRLVHAACPDVEETIKWNFPHFLHRGMLCSMAAFKAHCTFGFWKGKLIFAGRSPAEAAHGQFGRITSRTDLPGDKILLGYIRRAVELNEAGVKTSRPKPKATKALAVPDDLLAALAKNKKALTVFENFSPSHKREYIEWITEAKREETRIKRIKAAIAQMAKGNSRYWKYQ